MNQGTIIIHPQTTFQALRRPVEHACVCGHSEHIVPPCGKGQIRWECQCGRYYKLSFAGQNDQCEENFQLIVGVG